jgi:hypothetical protein
MTKTHKVMYSKLLSALLGYTIVVGRVIRSDGLDTGRLFPATTIETKILERSRNLHLGFRNEFQGNLLEENLRLLPDWRQVLV